MFIALIVVYVAYLVSEWPGAEVAAMILFFTSLATMVSGAILVELTRLR